MCGILAALLLTGDAEQNRRRVLRASKLLRHRGPDQNSVYQAPDGRAFIAFERLMIVDPTDSGRRGQGGGCLLGCAPRHAADSAGGLTRPAPRPPARRQPFQIQTPEGAITWAL